MTLLGSIILKMKNNPKVMLRKTMMTVEAVLVTTVATTFCAGGSVGFGLGVGVVGGGTMHADLSSFILVPSWQTHS